MRALLDTHTFIWLNSEPERIPPRVRDLIGVAANEVFVSAVAAWEISVKNARGHLDLPTTAEEYVLTRIEREGFEPLPIDLNHALRSGYLPGIHRDPFDRLLIAQAQVEDLPILTNDRNIARYDVEVIW